MHSFSPVQLKPAGFAQPAPVNHEPVRRRALASTALSGTLVTVFAVFAQPVVAQCTTDGTSMTCTGSDIPYVYSDDGSVTDVSYKDITGNISADLSANHSYATNLGQQGGDGSDATQNEHEDGQDGGQGDDGADLSSTMVFDQGYGMDSEAGGIRLNSVGGAGGKANEDSAFGTAHGGAGGTGGNGGDLTITVDGGGNSDKAYPFTTVSGPGIKALSQGGDGGLGGKGTNQSGFHQGNGGIGGQGGNGGDISVSVTDDYQIDITTSSQAGISLVSTGGAGNTAGEGLSDNTATGGTGGIGGNGGTVTLNASGGSGKITTTGDEVHGIVAISEAGDGGTGGIGHGPDKGIGGNGGYGGTGGDVSVSYAGDVSTDGDKAQGVLVQSLGGAGGAGGDASSWFDGNGGHASQPGPSGDASASLSDGTITTKGDESAGILVESVGGFAGASGGSSGFVAYGANGESGGDGGTVKATLDGMTLDTAGKASAGLIAMSIGGGGGSGSSDDGFDAIGAAGGAGGAGGEVDVSLSGTNSITTQGDDAPGIFALSAGGGGGRSGGNDGVIALGGQGGEGGNAGKVSLVNDGDTTVETSGHYSVGVMVSSVGNGGGKSTSPKGAWAIGANGGDGGSGNDVSVDFKSGTLKITTQGDVADGLLISSVGGGGGHGGNSLTAIDLIEPAAGTTGGSGGHGGDITISAEDDTAIDIETHGYKANGATIQSVGGGGGVGGTVVNVDIGLTINPTTGAQNGASGHVGGTVNIGDTDTVGLSGQVTTHGDSATGLFVQSIGGGGGSAGASIEAGATVEFGHNMGTDGGVGGDGGTVTVNSKTDATTGGDHADGILVQSVGGGGGQSSNVVDSNVGGLNMSTYTANQGSQGGAAGNGGAVTVITDSDVSTTGDNALGILVQSQGGGGGKAGYTIDADVSIDAGSVKLGSSGGGGGNADTVQATTSGSVTTTGHMSTGILAQSTAGGGGQAGTMISGDVTLDLSYTHGGDGGAGGSSGDVTLDNGAAVTTGGAQAVGVQAQSLGGGGGAGGVTVSGALSIAALNIAHGGDGGTGGTAGDVALTNTGVVKTAGDSSEGLYAQSVGGAGGKAGLLVSGTGTAGPISGSVNVSVGGEGGDGGKAGKVSLTNSGAITTTGYSSSGIYAQSVGGHGGDGGAVIAGTVNGSSEGGGSVSVTVGGDGGDSGVGGEVDVTNQSGGDVTTSGHYATALFAQSVGGSGGKGGGSFAFTLQASGGPTGQATVSIGGSGGDGATGGDVQVSNDAALVTKGGNAHGIQAQSIGGNGGVGASGYAFAADFYYKPGDNNIGVDANVAVGGSGGTAAHAGKVNVTNTGDITTATETSYGIYAQSVGGGGGDGGQAGSHTFGYTKKQTSTDTSKSYSLNFEMGGDHGASGDGSDVEVSHSTGTITTSGNAAYAIYAQSVGGGGGNTGNGSPGLKGWIADIYNTGEWLDDIYDTYKDVTGFPSNLLAMTVDIGGTAGASGTGGNVTVSNDGTLHTKGDSGTAIYAQSVGGGGGNGGDGSQGLLTSITVARSGSGGGNAGDVSVTNTGTITTEGAGAMGIYAQSVGGSGGTAGDIEGNIVTALANFYETAGAEIFGSDNGGAGGEGGDVTIVSSDITTTGANAHAIWAQSTGGGGGAGGTLDTQAITGSYQNGIGSAGDDGDGGYVNVTVNGDVSAGGAGAHGVFAQSASGGDSYSGGVKVYVTGTVSAAGENSRAILAQSSETGSDDPKGDATTSGSCEEADNQCRGSSHIYVESGAIVETTNSSAYETIAVSGGRTNFNSSGSIHYSNLVENSGTIRSADASSVVIANDDTGGLRIHNLDGGLISGSLQLSDSNRAEFENQSGATFAAGETVYLGNSGYYTGDSGGTISAYGVGDIGTSTISLGGTFSEAGTIVVDAQNFDGAHLTNDLLSFKGLADGAAVTISGTFKPVWSGGLTYSTGDTGSLRIVEADSSTPLTLDGVKVINSTTMTYDIVQPDSSAGDGNAVLANFTVDLSGSASGVELSDNAGSFAGYFSDSLAASDGASDALATHLSQLATDAFNTETGAVLEQTYRYLAPDEHLVGAAGAINASLAMNRLLQSCPDIDPTTGLDFLRQQDCTWAQGIGMYRSQDATDASPEFGESAWGMAIGTQREVAPDMFIEFAGQAETLSIGGENFSQDGGRYALGVALKKEIGRFTLSGAVSGGIYALDYERGYTTSGNAYRSEADVDGRFLGAELRASAVYTGQSGFYARPSAGLSYTQVWQDGFTETGTGALNWDVGSVSEEWLAFTPSIEVGRAFQANDHAALAFVRAGVTMALNDPSLGMSSTLVGADASAGAFNGTLTTDRYQGDLAAGVEVRISDSLAVSVLGQTSVSENSRDYGGSARIEFRF